ncbi:MAG: hypothetical protein JRH09_09855 [Deltaproteobacteria bacterium]|nr:hypothetical protein [Deltaproteobacteria bacterium]
MNEENRNRIALFPEMEKFIQDNDVISKVSGNLVVKLNRIIGKGKTKADGLDLPPAAIERKMELVSLELPPDIEVPAAVISETEEVRKDLNEELERRKKSDGVRRTASQALRGLSVQSGFKDNNFFAGRLVLVPKNRGLNWSWSLTPHYPIISKIPPDPNYLIEGYQCAEDRLEKIVLPAEVFESRLNLAWVMAKHLSNTDQILIVDVARMFKVAGQADGFWNAPKKALFTDLPEAAFIANLINWRRSKGTEKSKFEFVAATVHQAHGSKAKAFYMPINAEGTQVRPVIYLRRHE